MPSSTPGEARTPPGSWRWKPHGRPPAKAPGLLYEPGNWGDLLKAVWVAAIVRHLAARPEAGTLRVLDPYAGAPAYEPGPGAVERFRTHAGGGLLEALAATLDAGRVPSTGLVASQIAGRCGLRPELRVFDSEPRFRRAWDDVAEATVLDATGGVELLESFEGTRADLVITDPYDLFDHWRRIVDAVLPLAAGRPVLLYLFNKATRSEGHARFYGALREAIALGIEKAQAAAPVGIAVGRVPSDEVLPRAYHEVILLAPADLAREVRPDLRRETVRLGVAIASAGLFEPAGEED